MTTRARQEAAKARAIDASAKAAEQKRGEPQYSFTCDNGHRWLDDGRASRHKGKCPKCGEEMV
jgi:transcription initiation factor IIE alpha subunit